MAIRKVLLRVVILNGLLQTLLVTRILVVLKNRLLGDRRAHHVSVRLRVVVGGLAFACLHCGKLLANIAVGKGVFTVARLGAMSCIASHGSRVFVEATAALC